MKNLLSYIIPVYNVENYLDECISSIIKQQETGLEIILVDDGSTDQSGRKCDEWAERIPGITVIHKENGGLASARNTGLDAATGLYVAFLDSDDRIAEHSLSRILEWIRKEAKDLCFMRAVKFYADGTSEPLGDEIERDGVRERDKLQAMEYLASRPKFPGSACTKLFNRSFLETHGIRFPGDKRLHEDLYFTIRCIDAAKTYDSLDIPYYEYRQGRKGSITQGPKVRSYQDLQLFVEDTAKKYTVNRLPTSREASCIMAFAAYEYTLLLWRYSPLPADIKKESRRFLSEYQWILRFGRTRRIKGIRLLLKVFGIEITSKALNYYKRKN